MPSDIGYSDAWSDDGAFAPAGGDGYGAGLGPANRLLGDGSAYGGGDPYAAGLGLPDLSLPGGSSGAGAAGSWVAASGAGADPYSLPVPTPPDAGGWNGGAGGTSYGLDATPPSPTGFGAGEAAAALGGAGGAYGGGFGLPAPIAPDAAGGGWSVAGAGDDSYSLRATPPSPTDFSPSAVAALGGVGDSFGGGLSRSDTAQPGVGAAGGSRSGPADPVGAALVVHGIVQPAIGSVLGAPQGTLTRDGVIDQIGDTLDRVRRSGALTPAQWVASVGRCVDLANGLPDDDAGIRGQVAQFGAGHSALVERLRSVTNAGRDSGRGASPAFYRPGIADASVQLAGGGEPEIGDNLPPEVKITNLEDIFPKWGSAVAGSILAPVDHFLDITGPGNAANEAVTHANELYYINKIRNIVPGYYPSGFRGPDGMLPSSWKDRAAYIDHLRAEWAAVEYRYKGNAAPLQVETLRFLQKETDKAYEDALNKLNSGRLTPKLSNEEAVGNYVDLAVRQKLREFYNAHYVDFSGGQVRVQRRDYDTSGNDRTFRIPDARVGDIAFDVTLTPKGLGTPQIKGFFNTDARPRAVVIVRPSQLGRNGTYMITRPSSGGSL